MNPTKPLLAALALCLSACLAGPGEKPTMATRAPITSTFQATVLAPAALSIYGSVPGLLTVPAASVVTAELEGNTAQGTNSTRFDIRDIPHVKGIGIFSSAKVAPITPHGSMPGFVLRWVAFDGVTEVRELAIAAFDLNELNRMYDVDLFAGFSSVAAMEQLRIAIGLGATSTAIVFQKLTLDNWLFDAYGAPAAWSAGFLELQAQANVSHTFPLIVP